MNKLLLVGNGSNNYLDILKNRSRLFLTILKCAIKTSLVQMFGK